VVGCKRDLYSDCPSGFVSCAAGNKRRCRLIGKVELKGELQAGATTTKECQRSHHTPRTSNCFAEKGMELGGLEGQGVDRLVEAWDKYS
jgi:hypothetical protein